MIWERESWRLRGEAYPNLRRGALTAVPVGLASLLDLKTGAESSGALASGALIAGFVAFDAPARIRFVWQLVAAPVIGLAAGLGVLSSQYAALAVVVMAVVGIAAGLCVAVSPRLAIAAMMVVLALLIVQGVSADSADAAPAESAAARRAGAGAGDGRGAAAGPLLSARVDPLRPRDRAA